MVFLGGYEDSICPTQCFSNSCKKGLHELDFSVLWSVPGRKKELFLRKATGIAITARRHRAGKVASVLAVIHLTDGAGLVPSALFEHRREHSFGSGVASVNRCGHPARPGLAQTPDKDQVEPHGHHLAPHSPDSFCLPVLVFAPTSQKGLSSESTCWRCKWSWVFLGGFAVGGFPLGLESCPRKLQD